MSRTLLSVRGLVAICSVGALFGIFGSGCASGGQAQSSTTTGGAAGSGTGGGQEAGTGATGGTGGGTGGTGATGGTGGSTGGTGATGGTGGGPTEGGAGDSGVEGGGSGGTGGSDAGGGASGAGGCASRPEICNGLDDNCNGQIDEPPVQGTGQNCTVAGKQGVCQAGTTQCINGTIQCVSNQQASAEICDGLDNNCNGTVDEGNPGGGQSCDTGKLGVCKAGTTECTGGKIVCLQNVTASPEVCNGLDDDCNGQIDDNPTDVGGACDTGKQGICAAGIWQCQNGQRVCVQSNQPQPEICDGKDDDCNGTIDDPSAVNGLPCQTGSQGVCNAGTTLCVAGTQTCQQTTQASPEICDGLDNNCNGQVDEGNPMTLCALKCNAQNPPNLSALHVTGMTCTSGACAITGCSPGYHDSNGNYCDGCETQSCAQTPTITPCGAGNGATVVAVAPGPATQKSGQILTVNASVWYEVNFSQPAAGSGFHPTITLAAGATEYSMNVLTDCSTPATCPADPGQNGDGIQTWEMNFANPVACGVPNGACTDNVSLGPIWVEVTRTSIPNTGTDPECDQFTVSFQQ